MLLERIENDYKEAMKAHDAGRVSVLRMLISSVKNAAIAARTSAKQALDDADVEGVVKSEVKKLKDAMADFSKAARHDLVEASEKELAVLASYLPKALDPNDLKAIVDEVVARVRAEGVSEFGPIMKEAMKAVQGRADGDTVAQAVREALQK